MAIAYDTSGAATFGSASSKTWSHTMSATANGMLVAYVYQNNATDTLSGVTYNGVAMTQIRKQLNANSIGYAYLYYLVGPATGANNVVATNGSSTYMEGVSVSYTGVAQTGTIDSSNGNTASSSTLSVSTTVVASNCWVLGLGRGDNAGGGANGLSGVASTNRYNTSGFLFFDDSNTTVSTGSNSTTLTASSGNLILLVFSFPAAGGSASQIKSADGVAIASIKSADGVANT